MSGGARVVATTVLAVVRDGRIAMAADGQVTVGNVKMKRSAQKVRLAGKDRAVVGFAGGAADALALSERLETKLEAYPGNVRRAAVELARDWRTDRALRRLEAMLLVGDPERVLVVSGNGDVIEPDDGMAAIGSGGAYALSCRAGARAPHEARPARNRRRGAAHCLGAVHLHQRPDYGGNAAMKTQSKRSANPRAPDRRHRGVAGMADFKAFTPREVVSELDRYVVGQREAKRAVAIALRNRWRRTRVAEDLREEIAPKNIIMIGPTGVGKTEIARRIAKLAQAPFLKVEASKFTEVGYVGRDVESIVRDFTELGVSLVFEEEKRSVRAKAEERAEERVLDALLPPGGSGSGFPDRAGGRRDTGEAAPAPAPGSPR